MLYLIRPTGVKWCDIPSSVLKDLDKYPEADLSKLEWLPAELQLTETVIALALRYGTPITGGILLDAYPIYAVNHPIELRKLQDENRAVRTAGKETFDQADRLLESMSPGWTEESKRINRAADESVERSIVEAQREAKALLEKPANESVAAFWASIGGQAI